MLTIVVTDQTASSRNTLVEKISRFLEEVGSQLLLVPQISIKPLAKDELRFHACPDICVVGKELLKTELTEIGKIKRLIPEAALIAQVEDEQNVLPIIEQLARLGADDVVSENATATEFFQKILLLSRRKTKAKGGKLILVDGGKGGVGITSLAAGFCDRLCQDGKRVAVLDLDFDTQDLCRFLQTRPYVNDNLQLLLDLQRPVTKESVEECLSLVWADEPNFLCMAPCTRNDGFDARDVNYVRTFLSVLQIIDGSFDYIVVDMGAVRGALAKALYRVADHVLYSVTNDPASLYASIDRLRQLRALLSTDAVISIVDNMCDRRGLRSQHLHSEFLKAVGLPETTWAGSIPFCADAQRWPASGGTLYSQGSKRVRQGIDMVLQHAQFLPAPVEDRSFFAECCARLLARRAAVRNVTAATIPTAIAASCPEAISLLEYREPSPMSQSASANGTKHFEPAQFVSEIDLT